MREMDTEYQGEVDSGLMPLVINPFAESWNIAGITLSQTAITLRQSLCLLPAYSMKITCDYMSMGRAC